MSKITINETNLLRILRRLTYLLEQERDVPPVWKQEMDELLSGLLQEESEPVWHPEKDKEVWFISYGIPIKYIYEGNEWEERCNALGLFHPTKEAAVAHLDWLKEALKHKKK